MAEMRDGPVRTGKWQLFRDQSDRSHSVPSWRYEVGSLSIGFGNIPYAKELDPYIDREGLLELYALVETRFGLAIVHCKRKLQLFEVVRREKSNFLKHASEGASCISTTRETKNTDLVPEAI